MTSTHSETNASSKSIRIVVADDEPTILEALRQLLGEAGYVVAGTASDGATAVRLVEELQPDVVLVDYRMPDMTGIEVASALRERAPEVGIVILSAYDDASIQLNAERIRVGAYLVKGCSSRQIFGAIDEAIHLSAPLQRRRP